MALTFIPALIVLLEARKNTAGRQLTKIEVEEIRDNATVITLPAEIAQAIVNERGYEDIDPDNVWEEWLIYSQQ